MWISFTSQNGETAYLKHENVDVVEGIKAEGPYIIGEGKPEGSTCITMVSGTQLFVMESSIEVMETIMAAESGGLAEPEDLDPESILGLKEE